MSLSEVSVHAGHTFRGRCWYICAPYADTASELYHSTSLLLHVRYVEGFYRCVTLIFGVPSL